MWSWDGCMHCTNCLTNRISSSAFLNLFTNSWKTLLLEGRRERVTSSHWRIKKVTDEPFGPCFEGRVELGDRGRGHKCGVKKGHGCWQPGIYLRNAPLLTVAWYCDGKERQGAWRRLSMIVLGNLGKLSRYNDVTSIRDGN